MLVPRSGPEAIDPSFQVAVPVALGGAAVAVVGIIRI